MEYPLNPAEDTLLKETKFSSLTITLYRCVIAKKDTTA